MNKKESTWEATLQKTVNAKILKKLKNKSEAQQTLAVNNCNAENIIRNICKTNSNKKIFRKIDDWLNILTKVPIDRVREVLYNIE